MPRVELKKKANAGAERKCGRCGRVIEPGEQYRSWHFRYGGSRFRCFREECYPRRSELTQSKMSDVFAAIEGAEEELPKLTERDDITNCVTEVAEQIRQTADEYEEAAEPFGYAGENMERAEEVGAVADELEAWYPNEDMPIDELRDEAMSLMTEAQI